MPLTTGWVRRVSMTTSRAGWLAAVLLSLGAALLLGGVAAAHAAYERSIPGADSLIASAPERLQIWFTQELFRREGENQIQLYAPDGQAVALEAAQVDDDDRSLLWVGLPPDLLPGTYRVVWQNLSAEDGDHDSGEFRFTLDPQAAATSTPMPAEAVREPTLATTPVVPAAGSPAADSQTAAGGCQWFALPLAGLISLVGWLPRWAKVRR